MTLISALTLQQLHGIPNTMLGNKIYQDNTQVDYFYEHEPALIHQYDALELIITSVYPNYKTTCEENPLLDKTTQETISDAYRTLNPNIQHIDPIDANFLIYAKIMHAVNLIVYNYIQTNMIGYPNISDVFDDATAEDHAYQTNPYENCLLDALHTISYTRELKDIAETTMHHFNKWFNQIIKTN